MSVCALIQTCDHYSKFWPGFWRFMEKNWDFGIGVPIYFCNEESEAEVPEWCRRLKTGKGTFVQTLTQALDSIEEEHVFFMLEDFWPISTMSNEMFGSLYRAFLDFDMDALQVSNYTPYYSVEASEVEVMGQRLLKFDPTSEWVFNFQCRFWKRETLKRLLVEPSVSESEVRSAITVEIATDESVRKGAGLRAFLFHYLWYPMSGVAYRGEFTEFGKNLQNIVLVDEHVNERFSLQPASQRSLASTRQGCSA